VAAGAGQFNVRARTGKNLMRKRREFVRRCLGLVLCAGCAALLSASLAAAPDKREPESTAVAVQRVSVPYSGLRDEAVMVLVGTALIGIAAAVRRAA
jgi:hypothetical protein